jgi:hypothetical protein
MKGFQWCIVCAIILPNAPTMDALMLEWMDLVGILSNGHPNIISIHNRVVEAHLANAIGWLHARYK